MSNSRDEYSTRRFPSEFDDGELGRIFDDCFEMLEKGESPDLEALASRFPEHAATIRQAFPALCVLRDVSIPGSLDPSSQWMPKALGDFRIIREIGRGGMGIVYEAEQLSLGRAVALKVLPYASILDQRQIQRFKNEANAAAMLHHANVVPIFGVGCERGIYYYAMQLINGQTLAGVIKELRTLTALEVPEPSCCLDDSIESANSKRPSEDGSPTRVPLWILQRPSSDPARNALHSDSLDEQAWTSRDGAIRSQEFYRNAARLCAQVARALASAHGEGVIHRDIKPSNIIIDAQAKAWVTDFGLARVESAPGMTLSGDVLGTLLYMSPEQLQASPAADHRTDIYSLGITIYELLTLRPVFHGKNRNEAIQQITHGRPVAPRKLNSFIPKELEIIVLKAIEREPADRYKSADEFADDLDRFVEHHPIKAKRPSALDRALKWSRRHSDLSWAVAIFAVISLLGSVAITLWVSDLYRFARVHRNQEEAARIRAENANHRLHQQLYAKEMRSALEAYSRGWVGDVARYLDRQIPEPGAVDYRGFDWRLLRSLNDQPQPIILRGHEGAVNGIATFSQGTRLASVGEDGRIRIWDLETSRELFQLTDSRQIDRNRPVYWAVAISPNERFLVAGSNVLSLWDLEQRQFVRDLAHFPTHITSVEFSPDGRVVAAHCADRVMKVVDVLGDEILTTQTQHGSHRLTFTPDGRQLIVPFKDPPIQGIRIFDTTTWRQVGESELRSPRGLVTTNDGRFIFYGVYGSEIRLGELGNSEHLFETDSQRSRQADIDLSPDQRTLAAIFNDGSVVCWRLKHNWKSQTSQPVEHRFTLWQGNSEGMAIRFAGDDQIVTCSVDGQIRVWPIRDPSNVQTVLVDQPCTRLTPDQDEIWCSGSTGVSVLDSTTLAQIDSFRIDGQTADDSKAEIRCMAFCPRRPIVAFGLHNGSCRILDRQTRSELARIDLSDVRESSIRDLDFSPCGRWLATACEDHTIRVLSTDAWQECLRIDALGLGGCVEFSPNGTTLALGLSNGEITLLECDTWRRLAHSTSSLSITQDCLRFTSDGNTLVSGHSDSAIRVWDAYNLRLIGELRGHEQAVVALAIDPTNRTLVSGSFDHNIRLWDLTTLSSLGSLRQAFRVSPTGLHIPQDSQRLYAIHRSQGRGQYELIMWSLYRTSR